MAEETVQASAPIKEPTLAEGFSKLSSDEVVNALLGSMPGAQEVKAPEVKPAAVPPVVEDKDKAAPPAATPAADADKNKNLDGSEKPADSAKTPEQIAAEKIEADKNAVPPADEDKAPVLEFKLPEDKADEQVASDANGWKELGKELGVELTEDNFDQFKTKLDEHYKNKYEINLGKYNAETQAVIEFIEAGGTIEQYIKPTEAFDRLISMEDKSLVAADLKARNFPEDKIEKELTRLEAADQIDLYAINIRETLSNKKSEMQANILKSKTDAAKRQDTYKNQTGTEHSLAIKNALNTVSDFMETPLNAKVKDFITSKEQKGEYANVLNDPKVKAEFLLWYEFGKSATTNLRQKAYHEGVSKYKNDRHNIPPVNTDGQAGAKGSLHTSKDGDSQWAALENFDPSLLKK